MQATHSTDSEITLSCGQLRAVVAPYGASLRRFFEVEPSTSKERDIVWGYSGSANKKGGQGDVLVPFPGRIRDGRYTFEGKSLQLACNDKDGPNAIHGFLRTTMWKVDHQSPALVEFSNPIQAQEYESRGYPFSIETQITYRLTNAGLECSFRIRNTGSTPAPVGIGFHPYFTVGNDLIDDSLAEIPATRFLEFENLIPTGKWIEAQGTPFDFRKSKRIGKTVFNHCYGGLQAGADGKTRFKLTNPKTGRIVTVWADASFPYVVVYTGDTIAQPNARRALAIEPMTCASDAFNHADWGMKKLAPGKEFSGSYGIAAETRSI